MSFLRRRLVEKPAPSTVGDSLPSSPGESLTVVSTAKLTYLKDKRSKRRNGLIFTLGGLFGIMVAVFFANQHDVISFEGLMDLNLDSLVDAIPAGIVREASDITVCRNNHPCRRTQRLNQELIQVVH
jgi:phospholipid:diacylglycerol acyltransferase